jgi:hypothetical protein
MNSEYVYPIQFRELRTDVSLLDKKNWEGLMPVQLLQIRPESSDHFPPTEVRLFRDSQALYGKFSVQDRYVRCVQTGYQAKVSKDSCVEFFLKPEGSTGYFNFEFNCGSNLLCYYIRNPKKKDGKRIDYDVLSKEDLMMVQRESTLPMVIEKELTEDIYWELAFRIPFALIQKYTPLSSQTFNETWHGNFYKCADETSMPHWISWTPLPEKNFHLPAYFGELRFKDKDQKSIPCEAGELFEP